MKQIDIDKVKNETYEERKEFEGSRDNLEEKYHVHLINFNFLIDLINLKKHNFILEIIYNLNV